MKEYKGEKVIAGLKARLMSPASRYPDSMCELILTERHLYIMENGTVISAIRWMMDGCQDAAACKRIQVSDKNKTEVFL